MRLDTRLADSRSSGDRMVRAFCRTLRQSAISAKLWLSSAELVRVVHELDVYFLIPWWTNLHCGSRSAQWEVG